MPLLSCIIWKADFSFPSTGIKKNNKKKILPIVMSFNDRNKVLFFVFVCLFLLIANYCWFKSVIKQHTSILKDLHRCFDTTLCRGKKKQQNRKDCGSNRAADLHNIISKTPKRKWDCAEKWKFILFSSRKAHLLPPRTMWHEVKVAERG